MSRSEQATPTERVVPWLVGASLAVTPALANGCSVAGEGRCSACGGCVVALATLSGWALLKRRKGAALPTES